MFDPDLLSVMCCTCCHLFIIIIVGVDVLI